MAENDRTQDDSAGLRQRAEALWRKQAAHRRHTSQDSGDLALTEALNLLHELEVHQIELEMQNEELRRAQEELSASRARYFDLYDLAPVGYLTLSEKGLILEANLTAANLLGLERGQLVKQPLSRFIAPDDQDVYYLHRKRLLANGQLQVCELRMVRGGHNPRAERRVHKPTGLGQSPPRSSKAAAPAAASPPAAGPLWVRMQATVTQSDADVPVWRVTLSDITERKWAEDALQLAHDDLERRVYERTAELEAANDALRQSHNQYQLLARRMVEAQENERRIISRELHDGAGQALTCMLLDLGALARDAAGSPDIALKVEKLKVATDGLMSELHTLGASLHPIALSRLGLVSALRQHMNSLQHATDLQIQFDDLGFDGNRLPPEVELALYRVAQESVNNAIRHAQAHHISVFLEWQADRLLVTIEDDGIGFNAEAPAEDRLGLLSMHERIEMLGGRLTIESSPAAGTSVLVEVPL